MVRAYFGAKNSITLNEHNTHRGINFKECGDPSERAYIYTPSNEGRLWCCNGGYAVF